MASARWGFRLSPGVLGSRLRERISGSHVSVAVWLVAASVVAYMLAGRARTFEYIGIAQALQYEVSSVREGAHGQARMSMAVRAPEDGTCLLRRSVMHGARRSASRPRVVRIEPPLNIPKPLLDRLVAALDESLAAPRP